MTKVARTEPIAVPSDRASNAKYAYDSIDEAFPVAEANLEPAGTRVVVQLRTPKQKSAGGIILTDDTQDTEKWNSQVAKVVAVGRAAFRNRTTLEPWPEGAWCKVGDYVRVPKYGTDMWEVKNAKGQTAIFKTVRDLDVGGIVPDPLSVIAYI